MEYTSLKELQNAIKEQITSRDNQAVNALMKIFSFQTADEQNSECTRHENGEGFTGSDAEILTSFAKQYVRYHRLSEKQMALLKKKIGKYAGQLTRNAIAEGIYVKEGKCYIVASK